MNIYTKRWEKLQQRLAQNGWHGMLVTHNVDLFYFTGSLQNGYLFVPTEGEPVFYVRKSVTRAAKESVCRTVELGSMRQFGEQLKKDFPLLNQRDISIALEYDVLPLQLFERFKRALPDVEWQDGTQIIRELRMIKDESEMTHMRAAARAVDRALEYAMQKLAPGMSELELMAHVEYSLRLDGHAGIMRMRSHNQEIITGMIGSGEAAAEPTYFDGPAGGRGLSAATPQSVSRKPIQEGEPILIDIGCCIDGYVIDQTRTAVIGKLPTDLEDAYKLAEEILHETERKLRPGTICEDLYKQALAKADQAGLKDHFMGYGKDRVKFLGHGIGLEIDDWPVLAERFRYPLEPGMVLAVEPKFSFPGRGVVGIENSYLITPDGYEKLTVSREGLWIL